MLVVVRLQDIVVLVLENLLVDNLKLGLDLQVIEAC